jgi:acetyl-CoA/propionyl-CoA carboxylase biotin carboxyl carrier protein
MTRPTSSSAPLLIKPSAGVGRKGIRIVRDLSVLDREIEAARHEGERYFGDGRLFVEGDVEHPLYIEVHVMGDTHVQLEHF